MISGDILTTSSSLNDIKDAIIFKGVTPSGGITTYATAIENIPSNVVVKRKIFPEGVYQMPTNNFTFRLPQNAIDVGDNSLHNAFYDCSSLTSVDLSSLTAVSGDYALFEAFYGCTNLTDVDLSSLTTISGFNGMSSAFEGCTSLTSVDLSSLTTISGSNGLYEAFVDCTSLVSADLSSLTTISGDNGMYDAFVGCINLTNIDLSSLTTISSSYGLYDAFYNCSNLASVDLSSLTTISMEEGMSYTFQSCTSLTSVDLSSLTTISGYLGMESAFAGCTSLTSVNLSSLENISESGVLSYAFNGCESLKSLSFPSLTSLSFGSYTDQFYEMLSGVTNCTVHFQSSLQSLMSSWSDVIAGFGGTNTTVLFDLNGIRRAYTYVERVYYDDIEDYEDVEHTIYTDVDVSELQTGDTMYYISNNSFLAKGTISAIDGNNITLSQQSSYVMGGSQSTSLTLWGITYDTYRVVVNLLGRAEPGYTLNIIFYDSSNHEIDTITYPSSVTIPTSVAITTIPYGTSKVTATLTSTSGFYGRNIESIYNYFGGQTYTRDSSKDIIIN